MRAKRFVREVLSGSDRDDSPSKVILAIPHKDYHVWTFSLLDRCLGGGRIKLVDISRWRNKDERVYQEAKRQGIGLIEADAWRGVKNELRPAALCVMNDWEPNTRAIVENANRAGLPTIGLVEGIQDYHDVDTARRRQPYRFVKHVILPGKHDKKYFKDVKAPNCYIGGFPRIEEIYVPLSNARFPIEPLVLINLNFSYGVLTSRRDEWLESCIKCCEDLGLRYWITQHPADNKKLDCIPVTDLDMYEAIRRSSVFLSRFSSGIVEALALAKPVVYFSGGIEKNDKFSTEQKAWPVCHGRDQLRKALLDTIANPLSYLAHRDQALAWHCGVDGAGAISNTAGTLSLFLED